MMKRRNIQVWLCMAVMAACSCGCSGQGRMDRTSDSPAADSATATADELPLPEVPSSLTAPEDRAEYIISHFWDGMDFADTLRSRDRLFMEQNFVNFISLFPHARAEALPPHVGRLLERAATDSVALNLVNDITEHYLADPNSPMRDEEYYILFLEQLLRLPGLTAEERERHAYLLETAKKNRPATTATDFAYTDRNGKRSSLHATRGKRLLLLFYDPACSHCSEILDGLRKSRTIANLAAGKKLTVLAVYTEGDRKLWNETKASMPEEWNVAIDESRIVERELYDLPAMPVIYLLDKDKTVLLKDPTPEALEAYLAE